MFVVDSADMDSMGAARDELHALLEKPSLRGTPLLVLGNKNDLPGALPSQHLIARLDLQVSVASAADCMCTPVLLRLHRATPVQGVGASAHVRTCVHACIVRWVCNAHAAA